MVSPVFLAEHRNLAGIRAVDGCNFDSGNRAGCAGMCT